MLHLCLCFWLYSISSPVWGNRLRYESNNPRFMGAEPAVELEVSTCHTCCLSFEMGAFKLSLLHCGACWLSRWLHRRPCTWSHYVRGHPKDPCYRKQKSPAQSPRAICSCLSTDSVSGFLASSADLRDWACFPPQHYRCWLWREIAGRSSPALVPTVLPNTHRIWTIIPATVLIAVTLCCTCLYARHPKYIVTAPYNSPHWHLLFPVWRWGELWVDFPTKVWPARS